MRNTGRKTVKTGRTSAPMAVKASAPAMGTSGATAGAAITKGGSSRPAPTFEQIAKRSFELYLARGGVEGHDVEDWLAAEAELRG